jgi:hypothetical protein
MANEKQTEKLFDDYDGDPLADPDVLEAAPQKRGRSAETFAKMPHEKALALGRHNLSGAAWVILIELDRLILKSGGCNPVRLASSRLQKYSISPMRKGRALRQLEKADVITVERRGYRAPLVTHHWHPLCSL